MNMHLYITFYTNEIIVYISHNLLVFVLKIFSDQHLYIIWIYAHLYIYLQFVISSGSEKWESER